MNDERKLPQIKTEFVNPPIPFRGNDWVAYVDEDGKKGWGETPDAAISALNDAMEVRNEP